MRTRQGFVFVAVVAACGNTTIGDDPIGSTSGAQPGETDRATRADGTEAGDAEAGDSADGGPVGLPEACKAYCDKIVECFDDPYGDECIEECSEGYLGYGDEACQSAIAAFYLCLGSLDCAAFDEGEYCIAEEQAIDDACGGDGDCLVGIGFPEEEGCELAYSCSDFAWRMACDDTTCTCEEDGIEVATCDSMGICEHLMGFLDHAYTCCGWDI